MSEWWSDLIAGSFIKIYNRLPAIEVKQIIVFNNGFVRIAGLSGALSVALAEYGARGDAGFNRNDADPTLKSTFEIGNRMHMLHSVALLASPMAKRPVLVGTLLTVGITLFSGSCYYYAFTGNMQIRKVTPYCSIALICAWLAMIL